MKHSPDKKDFEQVVPAVSERLETGKRVVETGKGVRVTKTASSREQVVDEPLARDEVFVERVSIDKRVDKSDLPKTRYEGDTMIVPILEEILVTEKHTILKEEVRVTRRHREVHEPQRFVLRTDQVSVEHFDESVDAPTGDPEERD